MKPSLPVGGLLVTAALLTAHVGAAQTVAPKNARSVELSGLAYMDYSYVVSDPGAAEGDNGFGYRRLYLTSKYGLSDDVAVQARFETNDKTTNDDGKPSPFVKDLYVQWKNIGDGHRLVAGISSPPAFKVAEEFFGYRSVEKTLMDRNRILSSRDFGLALSGPLGGSGSVQYAVMLGNNNSVKRENDRNKRLYGQVQATPSDRLTFTVGGDYARLPGGSSINANAFLGYQLDAFRIGVEGYFNPLRPEDSLDDLDRFGFSIFAIADVDDDVEVLARFDTYGEDQNDETAQAWYGLAGIAWSPDEHIKVIPNVHLNSALGADEASVMTRVTLQVDF